MSALITMPRMGETMESGRVSAWLKKPGDLFERGETIAEIETDKVTVEMPALDSGRLVEILAPEGTELAVGAPLGRYDTAGTPEMPETPTSPAMAPPDALATMTLPRMGETMEEGRVSAWLKQPGERFRRGEVVAEIETDKVTVEMPALADGELVEILAEAGTSVAVGVPIARFAPAGPGGTPVPSTKPAAPPQQTAEQASEDRPTPTASPGSDRMRATPLARRVARNAGVELATLSGTGRRGRIEKHDVEAALAGRGSAPAQPSSVPMLRFVSLPQGRIAYREWLPPAAARRTIVLLHGFSADSATWGAVASALARSGSRVVAPDLPGHGATAIEASDVEAVGEAAQAFAQSLELTGADVLGHSMGAAVAVRLVAAGRLRPGRLILVAPAGLGGQIDADFVHGMASVTTGGALAHMLRRLARHAPTLSRPQLDAMAADLGQGRLRGLAAELAPDGRQGLDIVADLAAVTVPTRLIWGVDDRIVPWTQVAAAPSHVAIHLIADAGHMPHWDKPQDLAALLA